MTWDPPHLRLIQHHLEGIMTGRIRRLMIMVPPRHGKSELTTIHWPAYLLQRWPHRRVVVAAYNATLAEKFSRRTRNIARRVGVQLDPERSAVADWLTTAGGGLRAVGVGGGITGQGADGVIIDDPVKSREEADSPTFRDRVWDWFTDDLYTRLEPGGFMVLIMTRWHEDDLAGRILASEQARDWTVVKLPALAEADDALGRQPGDALWPQRYDEAALAQIANVIGSRGWDALYQQRPNPPGGAVFKREWFKIVDHAPADLHWVRYWDLAASTRSSADYTASAACAMDDDGILWVRDMIHGRWEWPDQRRLMIQTMQAEPDVRHGIEEALHGLAAVQELLRARDVAHVSLQGIRVDRDKLSRALPWAARAEAGRVRLVRGEWITRFLDETAAFPRGAHDDQIDAVSGAVEMIGGGSLFVFGG